MRFCTGAVIALGLVLGVGSFAQAVPTYVEDVKDWNALGPLDGAMYRQYWDQFTYTHTLETNPPESGGTNTLLWATLEIRHRGVGDVVGGVTEEWQVWFVGNTSQLLGVFPYSVGTWTVTTFDLSQAMLDEVSSNSPWSLQVGLAETTEGSDRIRLDYSKLYGEYDDPVPGRTDAIPEASTLILFGSGVSGLLFLARKKRLLKF